MYKILGKVKQPPANLITMRDALQILPLDHRDATLIGAVQNIACPAWLHEKKHVTLSGRQKKKRKETNGHSWMSSTRPSEIPATSAETRGELGQSQAESQTAALRPTGHNSNFRTHCKAAGKTKLLRRFSAFFEKNALPRHGPLNRAFVKC